MKRIIYLFILVIFSSEYVHAQTWNHNTRWIYETIEYGFPVQGNYLILEVISDTIINEEVYSVLQMSNVDEKTGEISIVPEFNLIMQNSGQKIYYYDEYNSSKHLLYDFSLTTGESYQAYCNTQETYFTVIIDSTSIIEIDGIARKTQFVSSENIDGCEFYGKLIEGVGSTDYLLPTSTFIDPSPGGLLLCFADSVLSYPDEHGCDLILTYAEIETPRLSVFPNPTHGEITIEGTNSESWKLINPLGEIQMSGTTINNSLSIHHLPGGFYYLVVEGKGVQRILKY